MMVCAPLSIAMVFTPFRAYHGAPVIGVPESCRHHEGSTEW